MWDQVEREGGGGIGMGNTCISMADSCQCMTKNTKKKIKEKKKKRCNLVGIIFNAKLPGSSSNWGNGLGGKVKTLLIIE